MSAAQDAAPAGVDVSGAYSKALVSDAQRAVLPLSDRLRLAHWGIGRDGARP